MVSVWLKTSNSEGAQLTTNQPNPELEQNIPTEQQSLLDDVLHGLSQNQATIPSKYLYDELGSALFEAITVAPEYYVTRADLDVMDLHLNDIATTIGPNAHVIEFGSGAGSKTLRLLKALKSPIAYSPIEISETALSASATHLKSTFPNLLISPVLADYTKDIEPKTLDICHDCQNRIVFFPGSTIGNFEALQAEDFLRRFRKIITALAPNVVGGDLIGIDLLKPIDTLIAAYDDEAGVTAAFNKNLLARLNKQLNANFNLDHWVHEAYFNDKLARIEMHLVSAIDQTIIIADRCFNFPAGKSIHTENSHKYSIQSFSDIAARCGLRLQQHWTDSKGLFATCYFIPA